jgi:DNA-binding NtrC family response regulator
VDRPDLVVIVESSDDVAEILRSLLAGAGFSTVVTTHAALARPHHLDGLLTAHEPGVFLWDVPPPLDDHVRLLQRVQQVAPRWGVVAMSTNRLAVEKRLLWKPPELLEKPFSLGEAVRALHRASPRSLDIPTEKLPWQVYARLLHRRENKLACVVPVGKLC